MKNEIENKIKRENIKSEKAEFKQSSNAAEVKQKKKENSPTRKSDMARFRKK